MSWLFSQALVEEYLGDTFLDGEQSAPLNGNNTQQAYCAPDKMTKFSRLSRFGMTYKPLTEDRGEELLTLYLEDFRARTSQLQEKEMDLMENGQECGEKWHGLLAKLCPNTFLWKTAQYSLLEDLELSLQTFPRWGLMQNGALYQQQMLVRPTEGTEYGFMPTPTSSTGGANHNSPTTLSGKRFTMNLAGYAQKFPTPTAHLSKETNAPSEALRNQPSLSSIVGGKLNPTWVEWLMGWPLGWTDLKPLEMDKSLYVQQQLGNS
jgi:hypothetical protein